jgi:tetratricopeptide (TPR) repeat protein
LAVAAQARESGDVYAAAQANKALISLALRQLGQLRLVQQAYPQAVEIYRRSLDFEDSIESREGLAIAQFGAKEFDEALRTIDQALKQDSRNARALVVRGRALMVKQDYTQAAEALSGAAQISPDIETYYSLGICYLATKDANREKKAAAAFQKMKEIAGDSGSLHVSFGRAYRDAVCVSRCVPGRRGRSDVGWHERRS